MLIIVDPSFFGGVAAILRSICVPVSECPTYFNQLSFAHGKWPKLWWKIPRNPQILHLLLAVAVLKSWKLQDQKASDLLDTRLNNLILGLDKKDFPMRELLQVNPGFVWRPGCFFLGVVPMWMAFAFIKLGGGQPPRLYKSRVDIMLRRGHSLWKGRAWLMADLQPQFFWCFAQLHVCIWNTPNMFFSRWCLIEYGNGVHYVFYVLALWLRTYFAKWSMFATVLMECTAYIIMACGQLGIVWVHVRSWSFMLFSWNMEPLGTI